MLKQYDVVIVGLGISGIFLGQKLLQKGYKCLVIEKSNNTGGRFAYRRVGSKIVNFGCSNFLWDKEVFKNEIQYGLDHSYLLFKEGRIRADRSYNEWLKSLAKSLDLKRSMVKKVKWDKKFCVECVDEALYADHLIITAPAPQAYDMAKNLENLTLLNNVEYEKKGFYFFESKEKNIELSDLDIFHRETFKDSFFYSAEIKSFYESFSREELKEKFDHIVNPLNSFAHQWRYANCIKTIPFFHPKNEKLHFVGDYFNTGGLKGSYESCLEVLNKFHNSKAS